MYLKEWAQKRPDELRQRLANWIVRTLFHLNHRHELFLHLMYSRFFAGRKITAMDIGAGSGYALSYEHANIRRFAVDYDNYFEKELAATGIRFIQYDIESFDINKLLDATGDKVDLLFMNHVVEHVQQPDRFVNDLNGLLAPEGIAYIRTPDIAKFKFDFYNDYTHVRPYTKSSLQQLFKTHGFKIVSLRNSSSLLFYVHALPLPGMLKTILRLDRMGRDIELIVRRSADPSAEKQTGNNHEISAILEKCAAA